MVRGAVGAGGEPGPAAEVAQRPRQPLDGVAGHGVVYLTGGPRQLSLLCPLEQEVGIDGNAVAAYPDARLVDVGEGLGVGGGDRLQYVDTGAGGGGRQVVGGGE